MPRHMRAVTEASILATAALSIWTRQGSGVGVGVGVESATTAQVLLFQALPDHLTPDGTFIVLSVKLPMVK